MNKDYLEKVIRPYGNEVSSLEKNGYRYSVGVFFDDFDVDNDKSVVFQVYDVGVSYNTYFDVGEDNELSFYNDYEMLDIESQCFITVGDLLNGEVTKLYREVEL